MNEHMKAADSIEIQRGGIGGMFDEVRATGWFSIVVRDGDRIREGRIVKNLVTNAGFAGMASRFGGAGAEAAFTYLELGISSTAAAVTDTTLVSAITDSGLARANATASRVTTTVANDTAQLVYTWTASGSKTVTEAGILNASSAGVLACRQVFTGIPLSSGNSFQLTYKMKFS